MRVVLDSNVVISAYAWGGTCRALLRHCLSHHPFVYGDALIDEIRRGLVEKGKVSPSLAEQDIHEFQQNGIEFQPIVVEANACRDPHDLHILGLAIAARADGIVTGDDDLLVLKEFHGISILSPAGFLDVLAERGGGSQRA